MIEQHDTEASSGNAGCGGFAGRWARCWLLPAALVICAAAGLASVAMGPDNNWDLRFYHLYAPWAYLHGRYLIDIAPAQSQGYFNPMSDFLFYAMISSRLNEMPRVIAFVMGAVHGLNAALVLAIASHVVRPSQPRDRIVLVAIAFLIGVTGTGFVSLLGTTTNDLINSIFVLASLYALLRLADHDAAPGTWTGFVCPGLFAGVALGLKFIASIFMPGLGLVAVVVAWQRRSFAGLVAFAAAATVAFLAVAGHHLLTLWLQFGNPIFPWANGLFRSPDFEPESLRDARFVAHGLGDLLAFPFRWMHTNIYLVTELAFREWRPALALLLAPAGLAMRAMLMVADPLRVAATRQQARGLGLVLLFAAVSYVLWAVGFAIYRYAVALEMLTGVIAVGSLLWIVQDRILRISSAALVLAAVTLTSIYPDWGRGDHPSAGIRPAPFGPRYVDVKVPPLPKGSIVLMPSWDPVAYFVPFAEPSARYLGIENNMLTQSQPNRSVAEIRRLMTTPGPAKFILSVGAFDRAGLDRVLAPYGLKVGPEADCLDIRSNLEEHGLRLCPVAP